MTAPSVGRVLIVDDEVELMTALCESLTTQGYEALGRTSAHEALALLQEQDIDLLVCDLMMSEMDGMALLRVALDIDPNLGGIIMTGQDTMQTAADAMQVGAFDYISQAIQAPSVTPHSGACLAGASVAYGKYATAPDGGDLRTGPGDCLYT